MSCLSSFVFGALQRKPAQGWVRSVRYLLLALPLARLLESAYSISSAWTTRSVWRKVDRIRQARPWLLLSVFFFSFSSLPFCPFPCRGCCQASRGGLPETYQGNKQTGKSQLHSEDIGRERRGERLSRLCVLSRLFSVFFFSILLSTLLPCCSHKNKPTQHETSMTGDEQRRGRPSGARRPVSHTADGDRGW